MLSHTVLGLLRDGVARHGYELALEYRARSGQPLHVGNLYRELGKLAAQRMIMADATPRDVDRRRIPYRITPVGCRDFDQWLHDADAAGNDVAGWAMFADLLAPVERSRMIARLRDDVWIESKTLASLREQQLGKSRRLGGSQYHPRSLLTLRRMKHLAAELEFLDELRAALDAAPPGRLTLVAPPPAPARDDAEPVSVDLWRRGRMP